MKIDQDYYDRVAEKVHQEMRKHLGNDALPRATYDYAAGGPGGDLKSGNEDDVPDKPYRYAWLRAAFVYEGRERYLLVHSDVEQSVSSGSYIGAITNGNIERWIDELPQVVAAIFIDRGGDPWASDWRHKAIMDHTVERGANGLL